MKTGLSVLFILILLFPLVSQSDEDTDLIDMDLDFLFSETTTDNSSSSDDSIESTVIGSTSNQEDENVYTNSLLDDVINKEGFTAKVSYKLQGGYSFGWDEALWFWDTQTEFFSQVAGADMTSDYSFDFQLTDALSVYQSLSIDFPDFDFTIDKFYGEYNLENFVFMKMGKFSEVWGTSRNYKYTNLPARLPEDSSGGDTYSAKIDIPVGIGGLQLLANLRADDTSDLTSPSFSDLGLGIKYNLAFENADIDFGVFYKQDMRLRGFASLETTLFDDTEAYVEGLVSINKDDIEDTIFAGSIGFYDEFLNKKISLNAEYYYNAEQSTNYEDEEASLLESDTTPFLLGHNFALNLKYKPFKVKVNFLARIFYNIDDNTGKFLPAVSYKPYKDLTVYLGVPLVLGDRDGYYYTTNYDINNRPFSISFLATFSGSYNYAFYE